jgi:hypothetical protein
VIDTVEYRGGGKKQQNIIYININSTISVTMDVTVCIGTNFHNISHHVTSALRGAPLGLYTVSY